MMANTTPSTSTTSHTFPDVTRELPDRSWADATITLERKNLTTAQERTMRLVAAGLSMAVLLLLAVLLTQAAFFVLAVVVFLVLVIFPVPVVPQVIRFCWVRCYPPARRFWKQHATTRGLVTDRRTVEPEGRAPVQHQVKYCFIAQRPDDTFQAIVLVDAVAPSVYRTLTPGTPVSVAYAPYDPELACIVLPDTLPTRRWRLPGMLVLVGLGMLLALVGGWGFTHYTALMRTQAQYQAGVTALEQEDWSTARQTFQALGEYQDASTLLQESYYRPARAAIAAEQWPAAAEAIVALEAQTINPDYRNIPEMVAAIPDLQQAVDQQRTAAWQHGSLHSMATLETIWNPNSIAVHPDEHVFAVGTGAANSGSLELWDLHRGSRFRRLAVEHFYHVTHVTFSGDGRLLAASHSESRALERPPSTTIWQLQAEGTPAAHLVTLPGYPGSLSPDGNHLAGVDAAGRLTLWRVTDGTVVQIFAAADSPITSLTWHPDGQRIASTHANGTVTLWQVDTLEPVAVLAPALPRGPWPNHAIRFSPDGQTLAASTGGTQAALWRLHDTRLLSTLDGVGQITSLDFSPDGQLLAAGVNREEGQNRGAIQVWRTRDGNTVQAVIGHTYETSSIAFSADGRTLISGGGLDTVRLWRPVPAP
jgi:Tol biopolymer transport system component